MPVKIAICDDNAEDIASLYEALLEYNPLFEIVSYTSGKNLVEELQDSSFFADLLFLDIYMPEMDGILTAKKIRDKMKDIKIIFLSSSKDHYPEAYELFAFNYMEKPLRKERLHAILDRALEELRKDSNYKISIQYKGTVHIIDYQDILYIESNNKLLLFHLADGNIYRCYGKLDKIMSKIPERLFIRCHQSYLVNASHITEMKENYLRIGQVIITFRENMGRK